jgi:two-component system, cell cycle response regulator CpdR
LGRKILVVDDDPLVLEVLEMMFQDLGCEVVTTDAPDVALAKLADDQKIEILVSDINMPKMNGYELVEKARQIREDLKVIMLSGREPDAREYPYLRKPFSRDALLRTMERTTGLC